MNGVFTEKRELTFEEMWDYFTQIITKVYSLCKKGVAFNVMSKQVDWERGGLISCIIGHAFKFFVFKCNKRFCYSQ